MTPDRTPHTPIGAPTSDQAGTEPAVIDPVVRATQHALMGRRGAGPQPPRDVPADEAVARTAATLFAHLDPLDRTSPWSARRPRLHHFYSAEVLCARDGTGPALDWLLGSAYANSDHLYLRGAALGVGASTLARDYADAFNETARAARVPRRAAYLNLVGEYTTEAKLLDALSVTLRARISTTELRHRGPGYLAARVRAAAHRQHVVVLTIDHVNKLGPKCRDLLAGLLVEFDPANTVSLDDDPLAGGERVGFVLVDHRPAERLFSAHPDVMALLAQRSAVLPPYTTVEQVAEAMRQAGIGLDDLDLGDANDRDMAAKVFEDTNGLAVLMADYLALIDQLARWQGCRPTPAIVYKALPLVRRLVELRGVPVPDRPTQYRTEVRRGGSDGGLVQSVADEAVDGEASTSADADPSAPARSATSKHGTRGGAGARPSALRKRKEARGEAQREQKQLLRKRHVTLR
jgi:hypothetical protein